MHKAYIINIRTITLPFFLYEAIFVLVFFSCFNCTMHSQLLLVAIFSSFLTTTLSLRCYAGIDNQCLLQSSISSCGDNNEPCSCVRYQFNCATGDQACTPQEQEQQTTKWAYTTVSKSTCSMMQQAPNVYLNVKCCAKNRCNKPVQGDCSMMMTPRQLHHELEFNDLLHD